MYNPGANHYLHVVHIDLHNLSPAGKIYYNAAFDGYTPSGFAGTGPAGDDIDIILISQTHHFLHLCSRCRQDYGCGRHRLQFGEKGTVVRIIH